MIFFDFHTIKLVSETQDQPWFGKDNITILVSDDNKSYKTYKKDFSYRQTIEKGQRTIYLENMRIKNPFIAICCKPPVAAGAFTNTLDRLITLLDKRGHEIPMTYSFSPRRNIQARGPKGEHLSVGFSEGTLRGFKFDDGVSTDNGLTLIRRAIDSSKDSIIAIAKGKEKYISGALSPAWPESRKLWLSHIKFALKSGVDGVDLRAAGHNRSYEWERYGFEKPVIQAYKKRYGIDITKVAFSEAKHRRIMGEYHTQFLSEACDLIHSHKNLAQVHVLPSDIHSSTGNHYMNFHWDWKKWLTKLPFDAVTIKDGPWADHSVWEPIKKITEQRNLPMFFCPYWKSVVNKTQWQRKLIETLKESRKMGHSGFTLYESAMTTHFHKNGKIDLLNPELPEIFEAFIKNQKVR